MKNMKKELKKKYLLSALVCVAVVTGIIYYYFFSALIVGSATRYVYVDGDDNIDSVYAKLQIAGQSHALTGFRTLTRHSSYAEHIRPGRYALEPGQGAFVVFRHLKNGM